MWIMISQNYVSNYTRKDNFALLYKIIDKTKVPHQVDMTFTWYDWSCDYIENEVRDSKIQPALTLAPFMYLCIFDKNPPCIFDKNPPTGIRDAL